MWLINGGMPYSDVSLNSEIPSSIACSSDSRLLLTGAANPIHDLSNTDAKMAYISTDITSASSFMMAHMTTVESKKPSPITADGVRKFTNILQKARLSNTQDAAGKSEKNTISSSTLRLRDVKSGNILRSFDCYDAINMVSFSPDERIGLSASTEIVLWDLATGRALHHLSGHQGQVRAAWFSPDGSAIISAEEDGTLRIWDVKTGEMIKIHKTHKEIFTASASPDGRYVLIAKGDIMSTSDHSLELWDLTLDKQIQDMDNHNSIVTAITFNSTGELAATASLDENLILWRIAQEEPNPEPHTDWRNSINRYLMNFLIVHCAIAEDGVSRYGHPSWDHSDWIALLRKLKSAGFGNIPSDKIGEELEGLASEWTEVPPLLE